MNTEQDTSSRKRRDGGNVCAYKDCKNRSYSSTNIIFHSFPKDPEKYFYRNILYNYVIKLNVIHRSKTWLEACNIFLQKKLSNSIFLYINSTL